MISIFDSVINEPPCLNNTEKKVYINKSVQNQDKTEASCSNS